MRMMRRRTQKNGRGGVAFNVKAKDLDKNKHSGEPTDDDEKKEDIVNKNKSDKNSDIKNVLICFYIFLVYNINLCGIFKAKAILIKEQLSYY